MQTREPIFNVPGVVAVLALSLAVVHIGLLVLLDDREQQWWVAALGFMPARYWPDSQWLPGWPWAPWLSPLSHMFVHGDWLHLGINTAWLLATGSPLARRLGTPRFLLYSLACGISGAVLFLAANPGLAVPVVGASGAISGLMGGMLRLLFSATSAHDSGVLRERPDLAPKLDLPEFLRDRRALVAIAVFVVINLALAFGLPGLGSSSGGIAWEAHIGGFACGVLAFDWFDRPAPRQLEHGPWDNPHNS